ncbi:MAG: GEVED domain-containing protein, partial [Planctomycetota bacterium]
MQQNKISLTRFLTKGSPFTRRPASRRRLRIEPLEDRRVLATLMVTTLDDGALVDTVGDGEVTLREAIEAATKNTTIDGVTGGDDDEIRFEPGLAGTIQLTAGEIVVGGIISVFGNVNGNTNQISIDAGSTSRIFQSSNALEIQNLNLRNGFASTDNLGGHGGAIDAAFVVLRNVEIRNSHAEGNGGAIASQRIECEWRCLFANNSALGDGGALHVGIGEIQHTTIVGNSAKRGGGVSAFLQPIGVRQNRFVTEYSTISGNTATEVAGGVYGAENTDPEGDLDFTATILAGNYADGMQSDTNFLDPFADRSIFGTDIGEIHSSNLQNVDWRTILKNDGIMPILEDNGGGMDSILPLADGPAVDTHFDFDNSLFPYDQRGFIRRFDGDFDGEALHDVGAVELFAGQKLVSVSASPTVVETANILTFRVGVSRSLLTGEEVSVDVSLAPESTAQSGSEFTNVDLGTFVFRPGENRFQEINFPLIDDSVVEPSKTLTLELSNLVGGDFAPGGETATTTILDDEVAGIFATKSEVTVHEDGSKNDFLFLSLLDEPASDVVLSMEDVPGFLDIEPNQWTFTPGNWQQPQTVNVRAVDNQNAFEGTFSAPITVSSGPEIFTNLPPTELSVNFVDDGDTRGVQISQITNFPSEHGSQAYFDVNLEAAPYGGAVTIPITSLDLTEVTVDPAELVFTNENWNVPQRVTLTGVDDQEEDGDSRVTIEIGTTQGADYEGLIDPRDLTTFNFDDELSSLDYGDAASASQTGFASSYPTRAIDNGARHLVGPVFLGTSVDRDSDGTPTLDSAAGDGSDEDGVHYLASLVANPGASTQSSITVTASDSGLLDAWIDFNRDGDWDDSNEQIFSNLSLGAGTSIVSVNIPDGVAAGLSFARYRFSTGGGLLPTGLALDGEVEDYPVEILDGSQQVTATVQPAVETNHFTVTEQNGRITVRDGSTELFEAPKADMTVQIEGGAGDDVFEVDALADLAAGNIRWDGGAGSDELLANTLDDELELL